MNIFYFIILLCDQFLQFSSELHSYLVNHYYIMISHINKTTTNLQKILFYPLPQPLKPESFSNIQSKLSYDFPLQKVKLETIQLIQSFFPQQINRRIEVGLKSKIQKLYCHNSKLCVLGKKALMIGNVPYQISSISAFSYGPHHSILTFQDGSLSIYTIDMKLIKQFKEFSQKKITFLRQISIPTKYEGTIILLSSSGYDLTVNKIQKNIFTKLSIKLKSQILSKLVNPITHIIQIPNILRQRYLQNDANYHDSNLICIMAIDRIWIVKIFYNKVSSDLFWEIVYQKKFQIQGMNSVSWGQALINSIQKQIYGDRLVLTYSVGNKLFLVILQNKQSKMQSKLKYEWIESFSLIVQQNKKIAFSQYMKKNQILLILENNQIIIFHTEGIDFFDKSINIHQIPVLRYQFQEKLSYRQVQTQKRKINLNNVDTTILIPSDPEKVSLTFADTIYYEYQSNQIYFLSQKKFGIYVYFNWQQICDHLKIEQKFEEAMNFIIALYKKTNRFEFGIPRSTENSSQDISEYAQILSTLYIKTKFSNLKNIPGLIDAINVDHLISIPIDFLVSVNQFQFLFQILKQKIAIYQSKQKFYRALQPFIEHGRIAYIPQSQLRPTFDYYISLNKLDLIEKLSIYFDLTTIDRDIVIQYLLKLNLVRSLAYICTQGNENEFLTPFARFWGLSQNEKQKKNLIQAQNHANRALWYIKICLQKNMALKSYSFEKYRQLINILTLTFFTKSMIKYFLEITKQSCLETLSYFFGLQIVKIVNQNSKFKLPDVQIKPWIKHIQKNQKIELLLSAVANYIQELNLPLNGQKTFYLLLFRIIIFKTIKFTKAKYLQIFDYIVNNYNILEKIQYGYDMEKAKNYEEILSQQSKQILASEYIIKTLMLVMQQDLDKNDLKGLYESAKVVKLTELQAYISFLQNNYNLCLQIFLKGKEEDKKRVFKFLVNIFKSLTIKRMKNQLNELKSVLNLYVKDLIKLEPKSSRYLILTYVPQSRQDLVFALQNDEDLQLEFLTQIIDDSSLSQNALLKYVELMCKKNPEKLIDAFKNNTHIPITQSIKICEQNKVFDCMEYLYQRMGNLQKSVQVAIFRIQVIFLQKCKNNIQTKVFQAKTKKILSNAISVCINNHSEEIWESLLNSAISLLNKYKEDFQYNHEIDIFYTINSRILYEMVNHSSIQYSLQIFQNKYSHLEMGGSMKNAFIEIISNYSYLELILFRAANLSHITFNHLVYKHFYQIVKPYQPDRICNSCEAFLKKTPKSYGFFCGHTYHKQCLIKSSPLYCINCMHTHDQQINYYLSIPNPQNPKLKIQKLFDDSQKLRLEMSQKWKIEQYEQSQRFSGNGNDGVIKQNEIKTKDKFRLFDEINYENEQKTEQIMSKTVENFKKIKFQII